MGFLLEKEKLQCKRKLRYKMTDKNKKNALEKTAENSHLNLEMFKSILYEFQEQPQSPKKNPQYSKFQYPNAFKYHNSFFYCVGL